MSCTQLQVCKKLDNSIGENNQLISKSLPRTIKHTHTHTQKKKLVKNVYIVMLMFIGGVSTSEDRMGVVFEELQDLRGVWSELSRIWNQIDELREKPWLSVQPRKLRQHLDTLMSQLKEQPARLRQYSSYEYVKKLLQGYTKVRLIFESVIFIL
jgi:dynein heavy chain 1